MGFYLNKETAFKMRMLIVLLLALSSSLVLASTSYQQCAISCDEFEMVATDISIISNTTAATETSLQWLNASVDALDTSVEEVSSGLGQMESKFETEFTDLNDKIEDKLEFLELLIRNVDVDVSLMSSQVSGEFNDLNAKVDSEFIGLDAKVTSELNDLNVQTQGQFNVLDMKMENGFVDVSSRLQRMENDISTVGSKVGDLEAKVNAIYAKTCKKFVYKLSSLGTFDSVTKQCQDMGGELITDNFGEPGAEYHGAIRALVARNSVWVGLTDKAKEGTWKFLNGGLYDPSDQQQRSLFYWRSDQPDGGANENCAVIWGDQQVLADYDCDYGIVLGLCEMVEYTGCN